jgi:prepilin-type N-terminal cleavage/methylation domain-containing protein
MDDLKAPRAQWGFSMPELVVSLAVILVMACFAIPSLSSYLKSIKQRETVTACKRALQTARAKALSNPAVHCGVHFDVYAKPQTIQLFLDTYNPSDNVYEPGKDKDFLAPIPIDSGATLYVVANHPAAILFRGDGSAFRSGKLISRSAGLIDTIDVLASTGRIRIKK